MENRRAGSGGPMQIGAFYNQPNYAIGVMRNQNAVPLHPQALYEGNMYGSLQGHHQPQLYGQYQQEYQQHHLFAAPDGYQGIQPSQAMYGYVPEYAMQGGDMFPSPQLNPAAGWHGGNIGNTRSVPFPFTNLDVPAVQPDVEGQYPHQYRVQRTGVFHSERPAMATGTNMQPDLMDDDDPPDLVSEDGQLAVDQKEDRAEDGANTLQGDRTMPARPSVVEPGIGSSSNGSVHSGSGVQRDSLSPAGFVTGGPTAGMPVRGRTLFVGNMHIESTKEELAETLASAFWKNSPTDSDTFELDALRLVKRIHPKISCIAYVDFKSEDDARRVFEQASKQHLRLRGRTLRVDYESGSQWRSRSPDA
jgi:hypothetical protein